MKDFRSLEHKIRDIVSETVGRNTEQRMKLKNVGRPGDDPKDANKSKLAKQGEIKTKIIDEATKKKVKEDDQSDDPIARINAVTSNLKQMTNEPKPAPSLPNVNDIPSDNPASKMFKIKEAASDSFDKTDDKKKEPKKDSKKDDGDDPKKITGGKTEVDLQPTTNDSPEMNDTEDKSSKKATNKANKEIGAKGVKEQVMSQKNFGLPESLIQSVTEVLKGKQKNLDKNHNGKVDGDDFKILRGEKVKEEAEQVDEVSKDTLQHYIRVASSDAANHAYTAGKGSHGKMTINKDEHHARADKRLRGISKAAQKLAKEEAEQVDEKYMGFKKLEKSIAAKGGAKDPGAVAAAIGRKKYGKEKFQKMAAAGKRSANEEVELSAAELAHIEEIMNSDKATVAAKAVDKPEMKALNLSHGLPKGVK